MHQPMQGARAMLPRYDQDAARRARDSATVDAVDCSCGHGPVVSEGGAAGKVRVVCCFCWRKTTLRASLKSAVAAWNAGKAKI